MFFGVEGVPVPYLCACIGESQRFDALPQFFMGGEVFDSAFAHWSGEIGSEVDEQIFRGGALATNSLVRDDPPCVFSLGSIIEIAELVLVFGLVEIVYSADSILIVDVLVDSIEVLLGWMDIGIVDDGVVPIDIFGCELVVLANGTRLLRCEDYIEGDEQVDLQFIHLVAVWYD